MKLWQLIVLTTGITSTALSLQAPNFLLFAHLGIKNNETVGALFECSVYTGIELIRYMQQLQLQQESVRIVEVGAGQGGVSQIIVDNLRPQDKVVLIELLPELCSALYERFPSNRYPNVTIINGDVLNHTPEIPYDVCICTLPFNGFPAKLTRDLVGKVTTFVRPGGYFSYVAYAFLPTIRYYFLKWGKARADFADLLSYMRDLDQAHQIDRTLIWRNIPPIYVHHLHLA